MQTKEYKRNWNRNWRMNPENREKERSRQRFLNRLNPKKQKVSTEAIAKWRKLNPLKNKAHRKVYCALRNETLFKLPCEHCLILNEKVQAHHPDYTKPLEVIWLCKIHHILADKQRRQLLK